MNNSYKNGRTRRTSSSHAQAKRGSSFPIGDTEAFRIILASLAVVLVCVFARIMWLQLINANYYATAAAAAHMRQNIIYAKRGTIYDRNGNILAKSAECKEIYADPSQIKHPKEYAQILSNLLGGEESHYEKLLAQKGSFVYIKRAMDVDKANEVVGYFKEHELPGIESLNNSKRVYPYGECANQVLGMVNVDGQGISGIEKQYNDILTGENGEMVDERGANGLPVAGGKHVVKEAKNGSDIILSLDINVQQTAEEKIKAATEEYKAESGTVIVTQPKTGEILAMCSTPFADFKDLSKIDPASLQLKPISSSYEPGSTFKVLTMAIGLEHNIISPNTEFSVPAKVKVGDDMVGDDDKRAETMRMTTTEILRRSSNTGAVLVGQSIGKDLFVGGIQKFGIGSKTGVDFPGEEVGILTPTDKFTKTTLGVNSFGQGLSIPALQLVRAISAVANEGVLTTPHFLIQKGGERVEWKPGERAITAETAHKVVDMMRVVVNEGTAKHAAVEHMDIAGKTGTGEQADEKGGYKADHFMASLVGFANAKDPEVLVYIGLNGTPFLAADSAAPTFSDVMREALIDMGVHSAH